MIEKARVNGIELGYELTPARGGGEAAGEGGPAAAGAAAAAGASPEAVIFLNGIAMTTVHWKPFVEALPAFTRLTHDFRGQVLSERPAGPYHLSDHVEDLDALLVSLGIRRFHLVGTSYGSAVGFLYALEHPEKVSSMVVIDGASEVDALLHAVLSGWQAAARATPMAFYKNLIPWTYSPEYLRDHHQFLRDREAAIATFAPSYFSSFVALCGAFDELDITARLGEIRCPTLALEGEKDILTAGRSGIICRAIPGSRMEMMPGAGHAEVVEAPGPLIASMLSFYRSLGLPA
jgi:3-oxoadipate enol-lactonase